MKAERRTILLANFSRARSRLAWMYSVGHRQLVDLTTSLLATPVADEVRRLYDERPRRRRTS